LAAVIVTHDSAACIGACISSIRARLPEAEIVVADNASSDESVAIVRELAPDARVLTLGRNLGFGRALNAGADAATASHLLLLNPDIVVTEVDAERLHSLLAEHPFGLVGPLFDGEPTRLLREPTFLGDFVHQTFAHLRPRELRRFQWRRQPTGGRPWISGAVVLVRRAEFVNLGGYDSRFFLYYEDRDLSRRYTSAGMPPRTTDALRIRHAGGKSGGPADRLHATWLAWSLLSWIEFVWIYEGERSARIAARGALATLRAIHLLFRLVALTGSKRFARKAVDFRHLLDPIAASTLNDEDSFYPEARRIVRAM
jgi:N-acetylglucosaminyl-diphospho-decaprenol L-rhamnosyltransferase